MTDYNATNIAEDWKTARGWQFTASDRDDVGNLSYLLDSSKDKKIYSSTRRVGKDVGCFLRTRRLVPT